MFRFVIQLYYDLIQFLKHVQTCLKLVQNYTTWLHGEILEKFEQTTDKVAHDNEAIPRTALDKQAVKKCKKRSQQLRNLNEN